MPAIVKILIIFASVLLLTRVRVQLGLALILGGVTLTLWAGFTVPQLAVHLGHAVTSAELWIFVVIMAMIIEVGRYLTDKRNADEMVSAVQRWGGRHGRAATIMALPAVIGLVPMPAGALASAPFVQQAGGDGAELANWKSSVNYWFRHVWEYWWPLYPGVIIAMKVFDMDAWKFISAEIFYTPIAIAIGYFVLVRPHVPRLQEKVGTGGGSNRRALFLFVPVVVVVASLFIMPPIVNRLCSSFDVQSRKMLVLMAGMAGAVIVILLDELRTARKEPGCRIKVFSTLLSKTSLNTQYSLAGVLIFKALLTESRLLPLASEELLRSGVPVAIAVATLPFLAGFVTGIALGFTGTSFPMVVGLMAAPASGLTPLATLVLAYGFGYCGMMLSPVHLCALVTRDYFSSSLLVVFRMILPCVLTILAASIAAHIFLRTLGW